VRLVLTRTRWLRLLHGADPEAWRRRFGMEPFSAPCGECGRVLTASVPFAVGEARGLEAPRCECGNERTPYSMVWEDR